MGLWGQPQQHHQSSSAESEPEPSYPNRRYPLTRINYVCGHKILFYPACTGLTVTASSQEPPPLSTWHHFTRRYHGHREELSPSRHHPHKAHLYTAGTTYTHLMNRLCLYSAANKFLFSRYHVHSKYLYPPDTCFIQQVPALPSMHHF